MAVAIGARGGAVDSAGTARGALGTTGARQGTGEQAIRRPLATGRERTTGEHDQDEVQREQLGEGEQDTGDQPDDGHA